MIALGGIPNKVKVADMGIDGRVFPVATAPAMPGFSEAAPPLFDVRGNWYPIQVKQIAKVGRPDIDKFEAVMMREEKQKGVFVSFGYTSDAETEIDRFFRRTGKVIIPLTVSEILDEQIAEIGLTRFLRDLGRCAAPLFGRLALWLRSVGEHHVSDSVECRRRFRRLGRGHWISAL